MNIKNSIYLKDKNIIFVYIPKVACTNWKAIFRYMQNSNDYLNPELAHNNKESGLVYLNQLKEFKEILKTSSLKKYTFIRNPFSRILSAFLDKFSSKQRVDYYHKIKKEILKYKEINKIEEDNNDITFFSFLFWLKNSNSIFTEDEHWIPQTKIIGKDLSEYNFIGHFENLKNDSQIILKKLNCDIPFPTQEDIKFKPTNATDKIKKYYSQKEIDLVLELFKDDFETLNYSKDVKDAY